MLTRAGVARRLGKSIATVRRMEAVELHATVDARGVHLFDEREVDAIAASGMRDARQRIGLSASGTRAYGDQHLGDRDFSSRSASTGAEPDARHVAVHVAEARAWAAQARVDATAIRDERSRLESVRRNELAASREAKRELIAAKRQLIAELEDCDVRVFRRLSDFELAEIIALLEME